MSMVERRNIAQCLDNALIEGGIRQQQRLFEATTTEDHISFLGIQLPVIAAMLPSLVLNDIATVQALDRRVAAVFYLDVRASAARGQLAADEVIHSSKTGYNTKLGSRMYAMAGIPREEVQTGDGSTTSTTGKAPGVILMDQAFVERLTDAGTYEIRFSCPITISMTFRLMPIIIRMEFLRKMLWFLRKQLLPLTSLFVQSTRSVRPLTCRRPMVRTLRTSS